MQGLKSKTIVSKESIIGPEMHIKTIIRIVSVISMHQKR